MNKNNYNLLFYSYICPDISGKNRKAFAFILHTETWKISYTAE